MSGDIQTALMDFIRGLDPANANDPHLTPDVDLYDGGYLDSFSTVELIEFAQARFDVDLSTADFYEGPLRNAAGIAAEIAKLQAQKA